MGAGPKPFCFENCWVRNDESKVVVKRAWSKAVVGSASFILVRQISATKDALKIWNREVFGVVQQRIKALQDRLVFIQHLTPSDQSSEAEQRIQSDLLEALKREESIWKQNSRISWLTTSDLNTWYFHLSTIIRHRWNNIEALKNHDGVWFQDKESIGNIMVDYFQHLYSSDLLRTDGGLREIISPIITNADNEELCMMPSAEEIKRVVFSLGANKALGPDGMSGLFYHHYWVTVGPALI